MGYTAPTWVNGKPPAINAARLNDLCSTVQTLDETMPTKQDKLTFDNVPTSGSSNPVKSSGIYTALQGKQSSLTFDSTPTQGSTNPVTSGGVYDHRVVVGQKEGETLGEAATSEGVNTVASGDKSHAEGNTTTSEGSSSHAEGWNTTAIGLYSHAEGSGYASLTITVAGPINAGATTYTTSAGESDRLDVGDVVKAKISNNSGFTLASAKIKSKTETTITVSESLNPDTAITSSGTLNIYRIEGVAFETNSHSEGLRTIASGRSSHSEGENTMASGSRAHAEGNVTSATGSNSHAEGANTTASGNHSHAEGQNTTAAGDCQHVFGQHNVSNTTDVEIVGWGTSSTRKNIRTLDNSGNMTIAGTLTQSSDAKLKTVEGEIPDVSEIHAVRFRWNDVNGQHDDLEHVGYIAQDVEKVAPFMVKEDSNGYKALDYIAFLCAKMELLERRVKELEEKKE